MNVDKVLLRWCWYKGVHLTSFFDRSLIMGCRDVYDKTSQIARFTGPTWGPPGTCRPQMGPMLSPWTLLSGVLPTSGRPTSDVLTKFEIQWNFVMFLFITYSADHNEILHTSRQCNCHDVCKISLWSVAHILNQSTPNFYRISNSIEIPLVGRAPGSREASKSVRLGI